MPHECTQKNNLDIIQKQIEEVRTDLTEHSRLQLESDKERMQYRADRHAKDSEISNQLSNINNQLTSLLELNIEYTDFKSFWKVGKRIGIGLALFITTVGIIFGGVIGIKEWIRK